MDPKTLLAPKYLESENTAAFICTLWREFETPRLRISLERTEFAQPYCALLLGSVIRKFIQERTKHGRLQDSLAPPPSYSASYRYLSDIGFFNFVRIDRGALPQQFTNSDGCFTSILYLEREALVGFEDLMQERVDSVSIQLAERVVPKNTPTADLLAQAFGWCLREAIRNSFEHGDATSVFFLAQSFRDNSVEFALLDEGIGIDQSLRKVFDNATARELVEMSILPGITEYAGPETDNKWQNSGFGLYVLSELAKRYGTFSLASNEWQVSLYGRTRKVSPIRIFGTAMRLRLRIAEPEYFANVREQIVQSGEEIAKSIPGARSVASQASGGRLWR